MAANTIGFTKPVSSHDTALVEHSAAADGAALFELAERKLGGPLPDKRIDLCPMLPDFKNAGIPDLQQHLAGLVRDIARTNVQASQALLRVTNSDEFLALQQQFMHDYLNVLLQGSFQLVNTIRQATAQASAPLG